MAIEFREHSSWPFRDEELSSYKYGFFDDIWKAQKSSWLPNTPPSSPSRSLGESSDSEESTTDYYFNERLPEIRYLNNDIERLQDVSENLDSTFDLNSNSCSRTSDLLQTKLISDCMWSGTYADQILSWSLVSPKYDSSKNLNHEVDKTYPTPCPSPSSSVGESGYNSNDDCVDPTSVFPLSPLSIPAESMSSHSESDEEIDVVTVDSKPVTITVGVKRNFNCVGKSAIKENCVGDQDSSLSPRLKISARRLLNRTVDTNNANISPRKLVSSSEESDVDCKDRRNSRVDRHTHNVLEKKRRIDLKKCFDHLRESVPELDDKGKVSKLIILQKAANYIDFLYQEEIDLCKEKNLLENQKEMLLRKLNQLNSQDR